MANKVFANLREVSCKAAKGKSICAFPDVCMTPPENPATPPGVPIPYPNTGMASDTTKGSRKVKISKKEVMLKNKSYFKKSMGDEAGSAAKKGVITSTNRGKVYFTAWSMDVKFEKSNVCRMLDPTTHNHMSVPGNTPPWPYIDGIDTPEVKADVEEKCAKDRDKEEKACADYAPANPDGPDPCDSVIYTPAAGKTKSSMSDSEAASMRNAAKQNECLKARKCELQPYEPKGDQRGCCPGQTGHHIVEKSSFTVIEKKPKGTANVKHDVAAAHTKADKYNPDDAPCICCEGPSWHKGSHAEMHTIQGWLNAKDSDKSVPLVTTTEVDGTPLAVRSDALTYDKARDNGASAVATVFPESSCSEDCIKAQLDAYHKDKVGIKGDDKINAVMAGRTADGDKDKVLTDIYGPPADNTDGEF